MITPIWFWDRLSLSSVSWELWPGISRQIKAMEQSYLLSYLCTVLLKENLFHFFIWSVSDKYYIGRAERLWPRLAGDLGYCYKNTINLLIHKQWDCVYSQWWSSRSEKQKILCMVMSFPNRRSFRSVCALSWGKQIAKLFQKSPIGSLIPELSEGSWSNCLRPQPLAPWLET